MTFTQKKQVRLNQDKITRLCFRLAPRSHKGFGFSCSIETAAVKEGCRSQNQYINDKHLLIQKALSE